MKSLARSVLGIAALAGATSITASAQAVISAKSGLVHYVEGRVYLNDQLIESKFGEFPDVKENQQLRTEEGRAEVLLTPGVFLRLGENSAIRMVTNRLIDTRLEFLSGSALVEADELLKDNGVTLVYKDYAVQIQKKGVYRFDSEPAQLRVYDGLALADLNGKTQEVKEGHLLSMESGLQVASFDKKDVDDLYRWGAHRSEYISMANVSAAKMVADSGTSWMNPNWYFNPYYNMFTFVPGYGYGGYYNPFGYSFWSPFSVYGYISSLPYYSYAPIGGSSLTPVTRPPVNRIPRGVSTAAAVRTAIATARVGAVGSFARSGSGHAVSAASAQSLSTSAAHASSGSMGSGSVGGGHASGGGGGAHK
jgi:hypothetical protein